MKKIRADRRFEQIYDYLLHRIERGEWKENDKLPSVRILAKEMNVNRLTVFKAYQLLKNNGKVVVKEKSGYYARPKHTEAIRPEQLDIPIVSSYVQKNHLSEIHRVPADYQFSKALIDPNLLPNLYLSEYVKKVFDLYPKLLGTYSSLQGDEELRDFLSLYFNQRQQIHLSSEELLITSGAQQAIDLIAKVLVKPMDAVLIERPTYSAAIDIFSQYGARIIPTDIHPYGYDLVQVEIAMRQYKPRLFYLIPTFHNPTGYTVPAEQRKRLVELAEQYQCVLVEDDWIYDIYFERKPPPSVFTYDTEGWVLYIRSFSKYVAPGLRIATVATRSSALMKSLLTAKSLSDNGSPLVNQKIFLHYFSSQRLQQHLEKLRIALHIRKDIMEEELTDAEGWSWTSPHGGLNLWVRLPEMIPMDALLSESINRSLTFVPGTICDPHHELRSRIRLSFSYMNEQQLREGLRHFIHIARTLEKQGGY
ncbi:PLP-dependent aminotransferase family protein [Paenibacillus tarimensis]